MVKDKLMEGKRQNKRIAKIAVCTYLRSSGGGCRECRYSRTKECVHANNRINEELLRV